MPLTLDTDVYSEIVVSQENLHLLLLLLLLLPAQLLLLMMIHYF